MINLKDLKKISSSLKVLYVEDDKDIANTMISYLSKIFEEVIYLSNGKDALDMYSNEETYDLVISDINMPVMNGITLAQEIKKINNNQSIIFVTGHSEVDIMLEAIDLGIDGYIIKPIDFAKINSVLYKVCLNVKNSYENQINVEQQSFLMNHISQRNLLLKQYTEVIDKVAIVSKADLAGNITYVNDLFCDISGYTREELIGSKHNIIRHPDMNTSVYKDMWDTITKGNVWEGTIKNLAKDGSSYFVHSTIIPVIEDKVIDYYVGIRFLSTEDEIEKREFKKKVRIGLQEYKKLNYELSKKVDSLTKELSETLGQDRTDKMKVIDLEKRLEKALFEVSHYEKAFTTKEEKKYDVLENYQNNLNTMTTNYQNTLQDLNSKKRELSDLRIDNDVKKSEVIKLNEKNIEQQKIIKDLRNTLQNTPKVEEKVEVEKKNIFSMFK